jgi:hypothetical protein
MPDHPGTNNTQHLKPFRKGDPRASQAGKRGAATRAARAAAQRATIDTLATHVRTLTHTYDRAELGPAAAAAAVDAIARVSSGEVPFRHAGDAAEWVRVMVDVARLEAGQATSQSVVAHLTAEATAARFAELQQRARDVLGVSSSPAVLAAGDIPGRDEVVVEVGEVESPS